MSRRVAPLALAALAVLVRLPGVWRVALSQDEVASARILRDPTPLGALHRIVQTESTPPLWYVLGWLVHHAGVPIVEVRLLSVALGAVLAVTVFALAQLVLPAWPAAAAAALVALGYEPVFHGSELRAYELLVLLAAALALVLVRALERPSRRLDLALAAVVAAGLLTHYFFAFLVVAALGWLWLDPGARALRARATVAVAVGGAVAAAWLPAFLAQYRHDRFWWIERFDPRVVAATPLRMFAPLGVRHLPLALAVCTVTLAGAWLLARSPRGRLLVALAVVPVVVAGALWAGGLRIYAARNLIEVAPFVAIAAVAALHALPRRAAAAASVAAVAAVAAVWYSQSTLPTPQYQKIARALVQAGWRPRDPIAVFGNFFEYRAPLEWYLPHGLLLDVSHPMRACPTVFVVEPRGRVVRLSNVGSRRLRRTTLLAAMGDAPSCVRLSTNPRLEPLR